MLNEESGEENKSSRIKSFIGGMAKRKGKKALKALVIKFMIPWGLLICSALFIIIFCVGVAKVGFTGEHTFSDTMNKYDNKTLEQYTKVCVSAANGKMDDYYGMAKRLALTEGNVEGYISMSEIENHKDINKMVPGPDVPVSEAIIKKYSKMLKPDFTYKDDYIVTTTTTTVSNDKGEKSTSTSTSKQKIKLLVKADTIKGAVDVTYKINTTTSSSSSTRTFTRAKSTTANTQAAVNNQSIATTDSSITNKPNSTSDTEDVTETTTVTTKVDKPIVDKADESKKNFQRLKGIIKAEFPNEKSEDDLNMCVHYVIKGTGTDYDETKQDGDWMNQGLDYSIITDMMGGMDGGFSGMIPLFRQTDPRWANIPYGQGTIATSGCGPTSFAMVVSGLEGNLGSWDTNGDKILDPGEAAAYAKAEGYNNTDGAGTSWGLFEQDSASRFGLNSTELDPGSYDSVYDALKNGYPVVASMHAGHFTGGGHFIVLTGVDADGQVLINDPNPATGINKFPMKDIADEANKFWIFKNPNMKFDQFEMTVYGGHMNGMQGYGQTADTTDVSNYVDFSPRIIAVDPSVIPMESKVYIKFPEEIRHQKTADGKDFDMNGVYTARDTGGAIIGKHIDLFMGWGAFAEQKIQEIGTRTVWIMKK